MTTESDEVTVGQYLLARLDQLGVRSMFGVPGDFNLGFLDFVEDHPNIEWIGNCNELNAAYAADGYARVAQASDSQSIGAVLTTFGVGELSAINGVAGAFSEHIPILHVVGVPSTVQQRTKPLLHHSLGDGRFDAYTKAAEQVTASQAILMDKQTAGAQIDGLLTKCIVQARPVYLALPTDMVYTNISAQPLKQRLNLEIPPNDSDIEKYVLDEIVKAVQNADGNVAFLVDTCALRHHVLHEVRELVTTTGFPVYSAPMGKSIIYENYDKFGGIYMGENTPKDILERVESAHLILSIGSLKTDFNTGNFTYRLPGAATIELHSDHTQIGYATFPDIKMKHLIPKLTSRLKGIRRPASLAVNKWKNELPNEGSNDITQAWLWPRIGQFFKPKDVIVTETGTASFGGLGAALPQEAVYVAQILWGSIGWSVGSALGAALAARERNMGRTCLFVGDGSCQLSAQEISSMIRHNLTPIIFLLNNSGYTVERLLHGMTRKYNDIAEWKWTSLLSALGSTNGKSYRVNTKDELSALLDDKEFASAKIIQLVEIMMDRFDAPDTLKKEAELSQKANAYAPLQT